MATTGSAVSKVRGGTISLYHTTTISISQYRNINFQERKTAVERGELVATTGSAVSKVRGGLHHRAAATHLCRTADKYKRIQAQNISCTNTNMNISTNTDTNTKHLCRTADKYKRIQTQNISCINRNTKLHQAAHRTWTHGWYPIGQLQIQKQIPIQNITNTEAIRKQIQIQNNTDKNKIQYIPMQYKHRGQLSLWQSHKHVQVCYMYSWSLNYWNTNTKKWFSKQMQLQAKRSEKAYTKVATLVPARQVTAFMTHIYDVYYSYTELSLHLCWLYTV